MAELSMVPALRRPRGIVRINDEVIDGWLEIETDNNTFYEADTFRVTFPARVLDLAALVGAAEVKVEVLAGFPRDASRFDPSELNTIVLGNVDDLSFDPVMNVVMLSGRDYTAKLIDAKTTEKFANQTASEIAEVLAKRHGLTPVVTKTTTKVGKYYEIDEVRLTDARTEWDLLTWLANETLTDDGRKFIAYVQADELHFEPQASPDEDAYVLRWSPPATGRAFAEAPAVSMSFTRNLTVLRDVVVTVKSWSQKQKKAVEAVYPTKAKGVQPGQSEAKRQLHEYRYPNLTQEQALQKAQAIHRDLTLQEVRLNASMPADNALTPRRLVQVTGTGTVFDQTYYPDSVRRRMSNDGGYTMDISAKNRSPESEVSL